MFESGVEGTPQNSTTQALATALAAFCGRVAVNALVRCTLVVEHVDFCTVNTKLVFAYFGLDFEQ